jgi:hypothetical protein
LPSWYRNYLDPAGEIIDDCEPVTTAVKALIKWPSHVNMEEFHWMSSFSAASWPVVGLFDHSSLETWVAWLTWFHVPDAVRLFLKPL